jgi:O-antigen ligase
VIDTIILCAFAALGAGAATIAAFLSRRDRRDGQPTLAPTYAYVSAGAALGTGAGWAMLANRPGAWAAFAALTVAAGIAAALTGARAARPGRTHQH